MNSFMLKILMCYIVATSALAKGVTAYVELSPAGSFEVKAKSIKGRALFKGEKVEAKGLTVNVKRLKTGLELRDDHLLKKLKYKKHPKITVINAMGENGKGKALFEIRGIKKEVNFTYKKLNKKYLKVEFQINLSKFNFEGISYMGVGVKDNVKIVADVKYK